MPMQSKPGNALQLFINVIIQEYQLDSLLPSGLLHNFIQINHKEVCLKERTLQLKKIYPFQLKMLL